MDNPFSPPDTPPSFNKDVVGVLSGSREDLRAVARYQKGIIICILLYFLFMILAAVLPPALSWVSGLAILVIGLTSAVFVFLLAIKTSGVGSGILLGIGTFFPCLGLIVLLVINGKATSILKANGIRVGFLGANLSEIP